MDVAAATKFWPCSLCLLNDFVVFCNVRYNDAKFWNTIDTETQYNFVNGTAAKWMTISDYHYDEQTDGLCDILEQNQSHLATWLKRLFLTKELFNLRLHLPKGQNVRCYRTSD